MKDRNILFIHSDTEALLNISKHLIPKGVTCSYLNNPDPALDSFKTESLNLPDLVVLNYSLPGSDRLVDVLTEFGHPHVIWTDDHLVHNLTRTLSNIDKAVDSDKSVQFFRFRTHLYILSNPKKDSELTQSLIINSALNEAIEFRNYICLWKSAYKSGDKDLYSLYFQKIMGTNSII